MSGGAWMRGLGVLLLLVGLAACEDEAGAGPDVLALLMPAPTELGVQKIQHKSVLVPDGRATSPDAQKALQALRAQGISSSAYFKYWLAQGAYKVRINVYADHEELLRAWDIRYPQDLREGGRSLALGDEGFAAGQAVAFRRGTALVEISASGEAEQLEAFSRRYADWVSARFTD